ncbi:MAG: Crp/Fnr family transcriptional regulator [Spirochaetaceae bacterium]|jgi:CRP-like cAMP-binding protein|nr:Crp/Fnr family transcriptional regulator [Spirochaetaceae bacterium]
MDANLAASAKAYQNGDIIFAEFETGNKFYLIQSGKVELLKQIGAIQKTLAVLSETEMFGEMALLEEAPRTATAIALGDVKLLEFDKNNFQSLVVENPQIAIRLLKTFAKRIYEAKRRFQILTLDDPVARIADVMIMLDETNPNAPPGGDHTGKVMLKTTPDMLARWAGLDLREAADAVYNLNKRGVLDVFNDHIVVKNINFLYRAVNSVRTKQKK